MTSKNKKINYTGTRVACYIGYLTQAIVVNLAPLFFVIFGDSYALDNALLGTLILIVFVTQILTDTVSVRLVSKISLRTCAVMAHVFSFAGLVLLGILPNVIPDTFTALLISMVTYSIGGGLIEVVVSPISDAIPVEENESTGGIKAAAMCLLHSAYCIGQVLVVIITTVLLSFIGNDAWMYIPFVWALVPLFNIFNYLRVPFPQFVSETEKTPLKEIVTSKLFIAAAVLMVCSGASELAVAQWASMFAEKGLGISKVMGDLLGPCAFALLMCVGRIIYGIMGTRIQLLKLLFASAVLCIISYLTITLVKSPAVSLVGCSLCGLSVSIMWPGVLSLTAREFPKSGAALFALLAIFGDVGCSVGPWLAGIVSESLDVSALSAFSVFSGLAPEQIALKCGILAAIVFPFIMLFAAAAFAKFKNAGKNTVK